MTGPEHYREAEGWLSVLDEQRDPEDWEAAINSGQIARAISAAQAHATLALAAATALGRYNPEAGFVEADRMAWYVAASEGPGEKRRQREAETAEAAEFATEARP